jgi:hypothetical protein
MVEVGCWKGQSIAYLGVEIINSGKDIRIFAVDTWKGSFNEPSHMCDPFVKTDMLYDLFRKNLEPLNNEVSLFACRGNSIDTVVIFQDDSLEVVFIDADHSYEAVSSDIQAWLPKVRPGYYLAGHDYCPAWPGVQRAVDELLGPNNITLTNSTWVYKKPLTTLSSRS